VKITIPRRDVARMKNLVREGKQITRIVEDDFPQYDYWDVYSKVYNPGPSVFLISNLVT